MTAIGYVGYNCSPLGVTEEDAVCSLCVSACQSCGVSVFMCSLSCSGGGGLYNV